MGRRKKPRPRTPGEHWANPDKPIPSHPLPAGWHWRSDGHAVFDPDTCEADTYTAWCPNCRNDLCLVGMQWPEPEDHEPGEVVTVWVSCYVEDDDGGTCGEDILVQRTVNAAGDGYDGPAKNVEPIG